MYKIYKGAFTAGGFAPDYDSLEDIIEKINKTDEYIVAVVEHGGTVKVVVQEPQPLESVLPDAP